MFVQLLEVVSNRNFVLSENLAYNGLLGIVWICGFSHELLVRILVANAREILVENLLILEHFSWLGVYQD